jgi:hypothetical protein
MAAWPWASWSPAAQPLAFSWQSAGALAFVGTLVPIAGVRLAAAAMLLAMICGGSEQPDAGAFSLARSSTSGRVSRPSSRTATSRDSSSTPGRAGAAVPPAARVSLLPHCARAAFARSTCSS